MHGQIIINNVDIYDEYKVSPLRGTYATLLGSIEAKESVSNNSRLENGVRYSITEELKLDERDFTISFVVDGAENKRKFIKFLLSGLLSMYVPKNGETYELLFVSLNKETTYIGSSLRTIEIKFKEPNPSNRN